MANIDRQKEEQRSRETASSRQDSPAIRRSGYGPFALSPTELITNPFSAMRRMHEDMDRIFADMLGGAATTTGMGGGLTSWSPAIEIAERDNELSICCELPGLKPEDVKVEVTQDALVIEGERKQEHQEDQGGRRISERRYGRFHRTIPLPEGAVGDEARADFKDGELQVTVPLKRPENKRRQIPIGEK